VRAFYLNAIKLRSPANWQGHHPVGNQVFQNLPYKG